MLKRCDLCVSVRILGLCCEILKIYEKSDCRRRINCLRCYVIYSEAMRIKFAQYK